MTNKQLAEEILQKVGGKKNINSYSHCSTRLRFDLKDKNSIDKAALERTDGILQVMEVAGQTQVVIGSNVQYVYDELATLLPQGNTSSEKSDGKKKGVFGSALELISSLFTPLIDVLIGAGILKGLLSILTATNLLTDASGTYQILNAAADSLYYFLPIVIAITCSKKLKTNMFVSVTIAGALLYPNLTALYDAGTAITFLGIPVHLTAFKSSVFPIIFAIVLLSFVEKGLKKILPDSIRSRIAPFFSLLIVVPVTIVIFGPLGSMLSDTIANFYMSLYKFNPTIAGGFIGAIAQVLVIFGIHWGLFPIIFSDGFNVCRRLREELDIPVIIVSARLTDIDKIRGFGLGADDYMTKPFSPSELVARVKAHIARYEQLTRKEQQCIARLSCGKLALEAKSHRVFKDGEEIHLTNREFELLRFLMENRGLVFSRETLFERIWGLDAMGDNATVAVHINRIREKIETDPAHPAYIETVRGAGYRFHRD